ncbi:CHAP domain-containing protein [Bacillus lacus]|uniref:CHAP domain-containing protein n=1 Tax=Metabacillus lacus TaxID=1983721 RepID=A0A7X2M0F1_9BACI|nr:amidase domain-containing protein [Metabacillus lacus]MRX74048.1 CHAP domain-containing protein [Metabacillus lacus]
MKQTLKALSEEKLHYLVGTSKKVTRIRDEDLAVLERKRKSLEMRNTEIVKGTLHLSFDDITEQSSVYQFAYQAHYRLLHKCGEHLYLEEIVEPRKAVTCREEILEDVSVVLKPWQEDFTPDNLPAEEQPERKKFIYDRSLAVQYAERWWNSSNSKYKNFDVNCTNFVSQCLHAGDAPTRGYPKRSSGWWMQNSSWSYSWTVAHSMKHYFQQSTAGLRATEVFSARELIPGDVICYDFQGDGRYDHTTIVVAKDKNSMPLVNAQTYNSRMRYWAYEDSTAYTPNIQYKFFHITDDEQGKK